MPITLFDYFLNNINKIIHYQYFHKDIYCYFLNDSVVIEYNLRNNKEIIQIKDNSIYFYKSKNKNIEMIKNYNNIKELLNNTDQQINKRIINFLIFMIK